MLQVSQWFQLEKSTETDQEMFQRKCITGDDTCGAGRGHQVYAKFYGVCRVYCSTTIVTPLNIRSIDRCHSTPKKVLLQQGKASASTAFLLLLLLHSEVFLLNSKV